MKPIKINLPALLISLVIIGMLTYVGIDAFKTRPQFNKKVEIVTNEFDSLKVFLTAKLPEIDSALYIHTNQIRDQNEQLDELNKLTEILKEK